MGTYLSKNEQEISESLREEYDIEAQPYLLHRRTQQLCTLHKLTANSLADSTRIKQALEEYQRTKCESISRLRTHYHLDNSGYCSDEQSYFLVFEGQNSYTLREEFAKRRLYRTPFNQQEIQQVAETYLCGLREYDHRFQRDYDRLSLDSLIIDQRSKRLYLRDPWLGGEQSNQGDPLTSLLLHYPSPEKLRTAYSSRCEDYKEFLSNLFSIGAIALELKRLEFADAIYLKKRELNWQEVKNRLAEFANENLRKGLECLLDPNPTERKKIYQMWGIQNREEHYLEPILAQKEQSPSPILKIQGRPDASPIQLSKFYPSTSNLHIPPERQLKLVPSQTFIAPPLTIQQGNRVPEVLSSRSNRSEQAQVLLPPPQQLQQTAIFSNYQPKPTITFSNSNHNHYQPPYFWNSATRPPTNVTLPSLHFEDQKMSKQIVKPLQNNHASINFISTPLNPITTHTESNAKQPNQTQALENKAYSPPSAVVQPVLPSFASFLPPTVANSAVSKPQSNGWSFNPLADYKESIYEQPRISNAGSLQTHVESPHNQRQVSSIIVDEKHEHPIIEKSPSIIDKILAENVEQHPEEPKQNQQKKEQSKGKIEKEEEQRNKDSILINNLLNAINDEANSPPLILDNNEEPHPLNELHTARAELSETPNRTTDRNRYNSTIVQVRDEDSPDPSSRSEQALEQQYVVEEYQTGSRYEGFKSKGMRNGRGKFYYQDGGYYQGHWRNNKMDGFGKLYYEGGKLAYEGSWSQDEFNGSGKVYNDNPIPLEAAFDYTNFELLDDYWQFYEGMLVHDTKEGRGRIRLSNGEIFEGDFHNDRIQGFGKFYTREGKVVEGIWRQSKLIKVINAER